MKNTMFRAASPARLPSACGRMRRSRGFTLMELMIIVTIIGILAAVAIPAYFTYTARTRVSEGLLFVGQAKFTVSENAMEGVGLSKGWTWAPTPNVVDVTIDGANGQITVLFDDTAGGGTLVYQPTAAGNPLVSGTPANGNVDWDCTGGTLPSRYRPIDCR